MQEDRLVEEGLKREIAKLTKERDALRADLRTERGEQLADEVCVSRWGTFSTDPATFHVRLSVNVIEAARRGDSYIDEMLLRMRASIQRELKVRGGGK
jgi:hypothetical protein